MKGEIAVKALVIYDSAFGNTAQIAQVIGDALSHQGEVEIYKVDTVRPEQVDALDLLVVGSPTQGFRATAMITNFLKEATGRGLSGVRVAAFDTRLSAGDIKSALLRTFVEIGGYAAKRIAKQLERSGGELIVPPEGFLVEGKEGPLKAGERERAADWGKSIADKMALSQTPIRVSPGAFLPSKDSEMVAR
jgi:flavodoxin